MNNIDLKNRRDFLKYSGAFALFSGGVGLIPGLLPGAFASVPSQESKPKVLITIFQRFGMDGLLAVAPYANHSLAKLRPNLMLSHPGSANKNARLDLGGGFGLHPAFSALMPFYNEKRFAVIHGVGQPDPTRSHSVAQQWWETGAPGDPQINTGWLNRVFSEQNLPDVIGHLPAVALSQQKPRIIEGGAKITHCENLQSLILKGMSNERIAFLKRHYSQNDTSPLNQAMLNSLEVSKVLSQQTATDTPYPKNSPLADSLRDIAKLIKAEVGLQLAFAESKFSPNRKGTWDTHSNAATVDPEGPFPQMATDFATSIAAFMSDLGPYQDDVIVTTLTDFGRTVIENDKLGSDHGRATAMFVLGGGVKGGEVYGELPEHFNRETLEDGMDLPVTTDFRAVLSGLIQKQLGINDMQNIFPGWSGQAFPIV